MAVILDRIKKVKQIMKNNKKFVRQEYLKNLNLPYRETYLKLFNEKSIEKCKEVINEEIKDDYLENLNAIGYFCNLYKISLWNGKSWIDDNDRKIIIWEDKFGKMCIKNLYKILNKYNKEHLKVDGSCSGYMYLYQMAEIER